MKIRAINLDIFYMKIKGLHSNTILHFFGKCQYPCVSVLNKDKDSAKLNCAIFVCCPTVMINRQPSLNRPNRTGF